MAEMDTIAPTEYTEDRKQRLLVKNIRQSSDRVAYLAQHCRDNNFSYDKTTSYLARNAIIHDQDTANAPKRVMTVKNSTEESDWLTIDATTLLFTEATRESSLFTAYQSFNNRPIRQSMRIQDDIWHALEPSIKEKVNAIHAKVRADRGAKARPADGGKAAAGGGIPAQCPNMTKDTPTVANLAETTKTAPAHTVVSLQNLNSVFFDDDGDDYEMK